MFSGTKVCLEEEKTITLSQWVHLEIYLREKKEPQTLFRKKKRNFMSQFIFCGRKNHIKCNFGQYYSHSTFVFLGFCFQVRT